MQWLKYCLEILMRDKPIWIPKHFQKLKVSCVATCILWANICINCFFFMFLQKVCNHLIINYCSCELHISKEVIAIGIYLNFFVFVFLVDSGQPLLRKTMGFARKRWRNDLFTAIYFLLHWGYLALPNLASVVINYTHCHIEMVDN